MVSGSLKLVERDEGVSAQLDYHLYFDIRRTEKYSMLMC